MPSVDATCAWAVPVQVEWLGAHLEAYINLQPTFKTLRLCNRFGQGDIAFITKLPIELVKNVEEILTAHERVKTRKEWEGDFSCFQLKCSAKDHYTQDELEELEAQAEDGELSIPSDDEMSDAGDTVHYYLEVETREQWMERHWDTQAKWEERAGNKGSLDRGFFSKHQQLFHMHFRLHHMWTSHVRLQYPPLGSFWMDEADYPAETTVAYLKMPTEQRFRDGWGASVKEVEEFTTKDYQLESSYGIPVAPPAEPTEKEQARFKRAMEILGLKPHAHVSQAAARRSVKTAGGRKVRVSWRPQLTMLVRCTAGVTD